MTKPLDPRLVRRAKSARRTIALTVGLSTAVTATVVTIALTLARVLGDLVTGVRHLPEAWGDLVIIAVLFALRGVFQAYLGRVGHIGARGVIAELRAQALQHITRLGPRWRAEHGASTDTLLTRGLDALDPYFTSYLPQLMLTVFLTPAVLIVIATQDLLAALTLVIAIPLIPVFMWLVGVMTQRYATDRLQALTTLGRQLLDLVAGIPTLRSFGRATGPVSRVRELATAARQTTMDTLRVAFLSGAILELISTIAVAMVAVGVGLRLVSGNLTLVTGLAVLIMAPEVLLPLRQVGVQFHNAADGVAAAEEALDILAIPAPATGSLPTQGVHTIEVQHISKRAGDRDQYAPLGLSMKVTPGNITALAGPSGSGKSTAMNIILGLLSPDEGRVLLHTDTGSVPLDDAHLPDWWEHLSWVPQRPTFEPATIGSTIGGTTQQQRDALESVGLKDLVDDLTLDAPIGRGGHGLSVGQRQRLALARALVSPKPFLILDEPTAHLDAISEAQVIGTLEAAAHSGKAVLVIAHRPEILRVADVVVSLERQDA